jgi:hypothetical protein
VAAAVERPHGFPIAVELRPHRAAPSCSSSRSATGDESWPTSFSRRSTTGRTGASFLCATRTPSTRRCARSG